MSEKARNGSNIYPLWQFCVFCIFLNIGSKEEENKISSNIEFIMSFIQIFHIFECTLSWRTKVILWWTFDLIKRSHRRYEKNISKESPVMWNSILWSPILFSFFVLSIVYWMVSEEFTGFYKFFVSKFFVFKQVIQDHKTKFLYKIE